MILPQPRRFDPEVVRGAVTGEQILEHYGADYRGTRTLQLRECPRCKRRQRRVAVKVNAYSGDWIHHAGPGATAETPDCKGDLYALVAAFENLNERTQFPEVVARTAAIGGISPDIDATELERIRAAHRAKREARERRAAEERARGEAMIPALWDALDQRHRRGEAYLASRGLDPADLRQLGDVVRYFRDGSPAVQLHSLETSPRPINIARRLIRPLDDGTKILTLDLGKVLGLGDDVVGTLGTRGSLVGRITDIDTAGEGPDVAILPEGVADSLAASLAYDGCTIVGANGWRRMECVAAAITPRLVTARGWLRVAVHADEQGIEGASQAIRAAIDGGLTLGEGVRAIDLGEHKDLADAWRAGWRPSWPDIATGRAS